MNNFQGIWLNAQRVRRTAYAAGLAVLTTAGVVRAGTIPRTVNVAAPHATNVVDLALSWQPVAADIHGQAKAVSGYNVYCSPDPRFVPDTDSVHRDFDFQLLPPIQAEAWAELHQRELMDDWTVLQQGRTPVTIQPLQ